MSYLHVPQLVFTGDFQADVSTVNNDVRHYDNDSFEPRFQDPQAPGSQVLNGWWNPRGGAVFRFVNCVVRQATGGDGTTFSDPAGDSIVGQFVTGSDDRSEGKMVDIDPQMQMVSELWAVRIVIRNTNGDLCLEGDLSTTGFRDLQQRQANPNPNNQPLGACWGSVLTNLKWGSAAESSAFARELRASAEATGCLSVQLTGFGYYYSHADGRFSFGRILGTIGPYRAGEPKLFAPTRRLIGTGNPQPALNYSNCIVDEARRELCLDLGGSFPITDPLGTVQQIGAVNVAIARGQVPAPTGTGETTIADTDVLTIGSVDYSTPDWLASTGGILRMKLTDEALVLARDHQLLLLTPGTTGQDIVLALEAPDGLSVRADQNIHRVDAGGAANLDVYAFQWGRPMSGAQIQLALGRPSRAGGAGPNETDPPKAPIPFTNHPATALQFPGTLTTGADGRASVTIQCSNPGNPRGYMDGQLYTIGYQLSGLDPSLQYFGDLIVLHVRETFDVPEKPGWSDISDILTQFGNLYPVMSKHIVDLSNELDVASRRDILIFAFSREIHDPLYMPVTRDLSEGKRQTILKWLLSLPKPDREDPVAAAASPVLKAAATAAVPRALARAPKTPTEPSAEDLQRKPAIMMKRALYDQLMATDPEGKSTLSLSRYSVGFLD